MYTKTTSQMTPQQIEKWKEHFTIDERLEHIKKRAQELVAARKRRVKAFEASLNGPGFVVSSTGRGNSSRRNGAHNTIQKRLSDARQSCNDNLETIKAMVNSIREYDL